MNVAELAAAKGFTEAELRAFGCEDSPDGVAIPYRYANGAEHPRQRFRKSALDGKGFAWSSGDAAIIPYGVHRPVPSRGSMLVVEGETDCWACWSAGVPAIGVPGASMTAVLHPMYFEGVTQVYVLQEPGEAGARFPDAVARRLYGAGFAGSVHRMPLGQHKDARALREAIGRDPVRFRAEIRAFVKAAPAIPNDIPAHRPSILSCVLTYDDLVAQVGESVNWMIEGMLRRSGILLMTSAPKVGKSELARNLARAVATGTEFVGRRCQQGKVLWFALEEPKPHLEDRIQAMGMTRLPISYVTEPSPPDEGAWIAAIVEAVKPDLVVVDTVGRFVHIESINDYSQVTRATQPFLSLRDKFGTTFVLLHHNSKAGGTPLGSTQWSGTVDTIVTMTRNPEGQRFITTTQRSGTELEATILERDPETGLMTIQQPKFIADQRVAEQRILDYLARGDGTREEASGNCGRARHIGRAALDSLVSAGLVKIVGTGKRGDPRMYRLVSRDSEETKNPARFLVSSPSLSKGGDSDDSRPLGEPIREPFAKNPDVRGDSEESRDSRGNGALLSYARKALRDRDDDDAVDDFGAAGEFGI